MPHLCTSMASNQCYSRDVTHAGWGKECLPVPYPRWPKSSYPYPRSLPCGCFPPIPNPHFLVGSGGVPKLMGVAKQINNINNRSFTQKKKKITTDQQYY